MTIASRINRKIEHERGIVVNDTSNRHQIMKDPNFWTRLAYTACGWLREADGKSLRRLWIDDFMPESATDTKSGVDIKGTAWVGDGPRIQHPYRFTVSVPQKMLHRRRDSFSIEHLILDETQQTMRVEIVYQQHLARAGAPLVTALRRDADA